MKTIKATAPRAKAAVKASPSKKSAPAVTDSVNTTFTLVKETKGALRYEQEGFDEGNMDATAIGTLYLRKAFFGAPYPQTIRVTVEAE